MEFQNQLIEDNDKIPSARIPINFDEFGKPLQELKRSETNDLVPEIVVNIIHNIKQLKLTRPYFTSTMEDEPSERILLEFLSRLPEPLIPIEVSRVLIKIQEKYGADHPYLCNSRFRHALHGPGCPREVLAVTQFICQALQSLCLAGAGLTTCHHLGQTLVSFMFGSDWRLHLGPLTEEAASQKRHLLGRILSELISEYRAVFEIESSLDNSAHEDLSEPRKRHDTEEDECPEDIKAMKVAWEELSLECSASKEGSPLKVDSRPQTPDIGNYRENRQSRLDFVKTFVNISSDNNNSGTHKESPVRCEENCCQVRKTVRLCSRKRKERNESSSSEQDNKFPRSSSLGCPLTSEELSLRWRSSSLCPLYDDGCGSGRGENVLHESTNVLQDSTLPVPNKCDDAEPLTLEDSRPRKKARNGSRRTRKERCDSMKENDLSEKAVEEEATGGGGGGENVCWVSRTLQHLISVESDKETLTMINRHPANLNIFNSERHIEHNQHLSDHGNLSPRRSKHKQISKQLSNLKRKMEQLETNFVQKAGYRPSQADKMTDPDMLCLVSEQNRLKKEIRNLKENVEIKESEKNKRKENNNRNIDDIQESLSQIEKKLKENRNLKARPSDLDLMSIEQIIDEKLDIQTVLLDFERIHGHPETKDEKEAMKDLYDRYRSLKMIVKRSNSARSRQNSSDLVSIPEEESLSLTLASPPHRIVLSLSSLSQSQTSLTSSLTVSKHEMDLPDMQRANREDHNWHSLPRDGLTEIQRKVKEEKKQLRRAVKELEDSYKSKTGRRLHKEDRDPFEKTYQQYKTAKAKLKLIDALLSKNPQ